MLTHLPDDVQHEALKQLTPFNTALKETSSNALQMNDEDLEDELDDEELDLNATQMETIDDEKSFPNDKISIKVNDLLASTSNTVSRSDSPLTPLNSVTPKSITKKDSIKKGSKDTVKQLLIWPELWNKVRDYFGSKCIFWFRDSPLIGHWKNISNMKAWEYLIFEHLYIIKGKRINPLNKSFDPVKSEGWDDFISKPYIGQGCRFFRRDIRLWVSDSKVEVAKIFKNVSKAAVPPEVLLVLKQLLSFEQNYDKLEEIGLFERPPSDADLELEAERRLNLMKSFYNPEEEVWTDHEIVQLKRTGIAKKEVGTLKRKSELMLEDKRINKFQKSSSVSSNVSSSDTEDDDEEASEDDFIMEEDQISAEIRKLAGKENPQFALKESKKYLVENISQNCDEKNDLLRINVFSKSGKSIAKNLKISNEADFTFKKLLQILPLPTLNNELEEKYTFYLQKKESPLLESKEDRQEVIFDEKDNCSLKLKTGDNLFIKREIIKKN